MPVASGTCSSAIRGSKVLRDTDAAEGVPAGGSDAIFHGIMADATNAHHLLISPSTVATCVLRLLLCQYNAAMSVYV